MSSVAVTDKRGGVFQVVMNFTYGECDRLPYNQLRKVKARIEQVPHGGIKGTAEFNIRNPEDAAHFVEVLDLFGTDGSFVHGSSADPEILTQETPPEDDDLSGIRGAATGSAFAAGAESAGTGSSPDEDVHPDMVPETKSAKSRGRKTTQEPGETEILYESESEPDDLETEDEPALETEDEADVEVEDEKDS